MAGGHYGPIRCCDRECAGINGCVMGGIECAGCGRYFCADEICESGYCDECEAEREDDENDEGCKTKCSQCKYYSGGRYTEIDHDVGQFMLIAQCSHPNSIICPSDESGCFRFENKEKNNGER